MFPRVKRVHGRNVSYLPLIYKLFINLVPVFESLQGTTVHGFQQTNFPFLTMDQIREFQSDALLTCG